MQSKQWKGINFHCLLGFAVGLATSLLVTKGTSAMELWSGSQLQPRLEICSPGVA